MTPTTIPGAVNYWDHVPDLHTQRALFTLDVIAVALGGRLKLKGQVLSPYGLTTEYSSHGYVPSDAKIVLAATRALTGKVKPSVRR